MQKFILLLIFVIPIGAYAQKGNQKPFTGVVVFEETWSLTLEGLNFLDESLQFTLQETYPDSIFHDTTLISEKLKLRESMLRLYKAMNSIHKLTLTEDTIYTNLTFFREDTVDKNYRPLPTFSRLRKHISGNVILNNFTDSLFQYDIQEDKTQDILGFKCYKVLVTSGNPINSREDFLGMGPGYHMGEMWVTNQIFLEANIIDSWAKNHNIGFPLKYKYHNSIFPGFFVTKVVLEVTPDTQK